MLHVADGWAARFYKEKADSEEVRADKKYLEKLKERFVAKGNNVETLLGFGDPSKEILKIVKECSCDLIAMSTHGHRFISDFLYGSVVPKVRHLSEVPVLLIRARKK